MSNTGYDTSGAKSGSGPWHVWEDALSVPELLDMLGTPDASLLPGLLESPKEGFLRWAVDYVAEKTAVDCVFVGELTGADFDRVDALVIESDGMCPDEFSYDLLGTPCQEVLSKDLCYCTHNVAAQFPDDPLLIDMGIEAYMGLALLDEHGLPLGIIVLLHSSALSDEEARSAGALLRLLQPRLEAELRYRRAMQTMKIVASTALSAGGTMRQLVSTLVEVTRMKCVYVAIHDQGESSGGLAQIVASNWEYGGTISIADGPCAELAVGGTIGIHDNVRDNYQLEYLEVGKAQAFFAVAIANPDGGLLGHVGLIHDRPVHVDVVTLPLFQLVVERMAAELCQREVEKRRLVLERRLAKRQHHEGLGILAGGIAHDFNNLLVAISGPAEIIRMKVGENVEIGDNVETILEATQQAANLCSQLLAYAGHKPANKEHFDLNDLISCSQRIATMYTASQCTLGYQLSQSGLSVYGSQIEVQQALMNLIKNAADAIPGRGSIRIETEMVERSAESFANAIVGTFLGSGHYACVRVIDTGVGMSDDQISNVFGRYVTTKETGHGIGLSVVISGIEEHGGALEVESEVGVGTTFSIFLPISGQKESPDIEADDSSIAVNGERAVLVIDDDELVRRVLTSMLSHAGVGSLLASGGSEGIAVFKKNYRSIDLVILDYTMPGLKGDRVIVALREITQKVPIVLVSGNIDTEIVNNFKEPPDAFLGKPFSNQELMKTLSSFGVISAVKPTQK
ncbi:MAG: response regulator [Kofleriaceae bacterium]|nr:response regulator [Kofleriaceae bacterium]